MIREYDPITPDARGERGICHGSQHNRVVGSVMSMKTHSDTLLTDRLVSLDRGGDLTAHRGDHPRSRSVHILRVTIPRLDWPEH